MHKVEVYEFLSTGASIVYGEYGFNLSFVAYPLLLDVNSSGF